MERQTDAIDFVSALRAQGDDDTVEIRILRPHETYTRTLGARAAEAVDRVSTDADEA